jgi:glycosyltransferase involved in cell wall biosynthesis
LEQEPPASIPKRGERRKFACIDQMLPISDVEAIETEYEKLAIHHRYLHQERAIYQGTASLEYGGIRSTLDARTGREQRRKLLSSGALCMAPTASVIVPCHDAEAVLGDQLRSLARQVDAPAFEVIVVLNSCTDGTRRVAESFGSRLALTVAVANDRLSAGYARNVGAALASAPYLLFCDADDQVENRWVGELVRGLESAEADLVGGRATVDRRNLSAWMYDLFYSPIDGAELNLAWPGTRYPIAASLGVRRAAFEAVGGFDESFPAAGYEEVDLTLRLLRRGFRLGVAQRAEFRYRPRTSFRALMRQRRGYARGGAYHLNKEGIPVETPSVVGEARVIARTTARLLVRDRQWRPVALAAAILNEWFRFDAMRRIGTTDAIDEARTDAEFVVPPSTPVVGGLAFRVPLARAHCYANEGFERYSLLLLNVLIAPGDIVVDAGAGVGLRTVCAALRVGASGRVVAVESDPRYRRLLGENVARHGVSGQVSVFDVFPSDALPGDGRLGATAGLIRMSVETLLLSGHCTSSVFEQFSRHGWTVWQVDEENCTAKKLAPSDEPGWESTLLAFPRARGNAFEAITGIGKR